MAKGPSDSILGRFAFDVQEAFEVERENDAVRREAAGEATERAARWAGARTKPRRARRVSPALASRARSAMEGIVGSAVRVTDTRIEIPFADETELEEIIESLERSRA